MKEPVPLLFAAKRVAARLQAINSFEEFRSQPPSYYGEPRKSVFRGKLKKVSLIAGQFER